MIQKLKTKALLVTAVLTMAATVFSCSKKDDEITPAPVPTPTPVPVEASIVGNWEFAKIGILIDGKEDFEDYINSSCGKDYMEIKANGTGANHIYSSTSGNDFVEKCGEVLVSNTWKKEDNKLVIKSLNEENQYSKTVVYEIVTLNATELKVKYKDEEDEIIISVYIRK